MDDGEHFCAADDPVNLKVRGIEVDPVVNGLLIVVEVEQLLIVGLVEAVDFVLHVFPEGIDLFLGEPLGVQVAAAPVFDEVFRLLRIPSISSP